MLRSIPMASYSTHILCPPGHSSAAGLPNFLILEFSLCLGASLLKRAFVISLLSFPLFGFAQNSV